jgi:hypothetical protein
MAPNSGGLPPVMYFKKTSTLQFHFSTNITLSIGLLIILTRLWSIRMVLPMCRLEILSKKSIRHLWKTTVFGLLKRKWLFILQNSQRNIHERLILQFIFFSHFTQEDQCLVRLTFNPNMKDPLVKILTNK